MPENWFDAITTKAVMNLMRKVYAFFAEIFLKFFIYITLSMIYLEADPYVIIQYRYI